MITNEKQYRSTKAMIARLQDGLNSDASLAGVHPAFVEAHKSALRSQIEELERDVADYEALRSGEVRFFEARTLAGLPDLLVRARIARGMSQRDLADFLGVAEQQIQRYEAERYRSASLERLVEVAEALHVKISERAELPARDSLMAVDPASSRSFPFAEMYKRGWFEDFTGTLAEGRKEAENLLASFFAVARTSWQPAALHRKTVRTSGHVHEPALAAWEARVVTLADRNRPEVTFTKDLADEAWLRALAHLSAEPDGPRRAVSHLRSIGISLVIEPHLPGTLLDGASMQSPEGASIVALTLRHDRLDNFWFTLAHEIGHLILHVSTGRFSAVFDDTETASGSKIEQEADFFAQEALLPSSQWEGCVSRFTRTERAVLSDAKRFCISPAIIAGRIRRENKDYTLLRTLIGAGEPRRQLVQ